MGDDLERMFAADEAAIRDDGFTKRVIEQAERSPGFRRVAIYGAGMTGFGVAVGSMPALMSAFPQVGTWLSAADTVVQNVRNVKVNGVLDGALDGGSQTMLVIIAVGLAVSISLAAAMMQER